MSNILQRGAKGDEVIALQRALVVAGISIAVDGNFGPGTEESIRQFQEDRGLDIDGKVGPKTAAALLHFAPIEGINRSAPPVAPVSSSKWPRQSNVQSFYGDIGQHQTTLVLPFTMKLAWDMDKVVTRFSVHEKVHDSAKTCFERIANAYDESKRAACGFDLFGGCLNVRKMRGGSSWSMHSWGIAIDFDPERNQLKWGRDRARLAQPDCEEFWRIWEDAGWLSLGRARNYDWMHVQAATL
mgnify:FL=1